MKLTVGSTLGSLFCLVVCTVSLDPSQIQVYPETAGISGVFMAMLKTKKYSFNATAAAEVCTSLGVRIATRAEVEMAQSKGLQTCRFGWVKEQIAVIPRVEGNEKCGQKKVGVITWAVSTSTVFEVFCFNSIGQSEATTTTTPVGSRPQARTTSSSLIQSTLFNKNFLSPSTSISSSSSTSVSSAFFHSTVSSAAIRSPHSVSPSIALQPLSTSSTSSSSSSAATSSSTILSTHPFTYSFSLNTPTSNQTEQPTQPPSRASFGEVPMACVIIAVMLVLMAAAGAVWYFKIKRAHRLPPWVRIRHKDAVEMWKHTDQQSSRKKKEKSSSSEDITLQLEEDTESP